MHVHISKHIMNKNDFVSFQNEIDYFFFENVNTSIFIIGQMFKRYKYLKFRIMEK